MRTHKYRLCKRKYVYISATLSQTTDDIYLKQEWTMYCRYYT